ncbi:MAG: response regulator transcription factor [Pseudomonadota bacterium]
MNGSLDDLPHVLIVDDDRRLRELLGSFLSANGCRVSAVSAAAEARSRMQGMSFDLIVLDVMMPDETGLEFAQSLRATGNDVPILMLSARAEIEHRIEGLSAGVDDYLTKPFEPRELLLRVQAILKRQASTGPANTEVADVSFGAFSFNLLRGELRRDGQLVHLTTRERDILRILAQRAGEPVARADIIEPAQEDTNRAVDVQINRLRRKIEDQPAMPVYLQTVRGHGYTLHVD